MPLTAKRMGRQVPPLLDSWEEEQEQAYPTARTDLWIGGVRQKKEEK